ncbi:helix-turn-helix domain-containing protein [Streptomyces sp. NRRL B-1347]|uniref:helix-turn-helix domain-containing protein n=1 Tax=Streptomyces sp. NRRL B-1347 TaxID=1476877 RepID=UPI0004CB494B|nr:helix-turn-helix domain-containing protein [Streptomyces sp. NRRL B-1347]
MPLSSDEHIGTRVRIARNAAGLTQAELAGLLGRTECWLAHVESGRRPLERFSVITAIAHECDVDVVWLLGMPYRLAGDKGAVGHAYIPALRTGLRRAGLILSGHPGLTAQGMPVDLAAAGATLKKANIARQAANLPRVAQLLAPVVEDLNTALLTADGRAREQALRLIADAGRTARMCLNQLGYPDLAWSAAEVAAGAAAQLQDPVLQAAVAWDRCGALLHQASTRETVAVADAALRDLESYTVGAGALKAAVSLRGALHLRCAVAHARGGQQAGAWERIDEALIDADRLGSEWCDLELHTVFSRGNVLVHATEVGVEVEEPEEGLQRVRGVVLDDLPSRERRTHYMIDRARALHFMGRSPAAVVQLRKAAGDAPYYVFAHAMARALVSDLARVGVPSQATALSSLIRDMELVS